MLSDWFSSSSEAAQLFRQEYLMVSLFEDPRRKDFDWLRPKVAGFAGAVMAENGVKALGVLAMTRERQALDAHLMLSPPAIAPGALAGLTFSSELAMRRLLLPGLAAALSL